MTSPRLAQWVDHGLITTEQADAIEAFEAGEARIEPAPGRRPAVIAEVVGSLGALAAAVAAIVGTSVLWGDLTSAARVAVPTIGATALLVAGAAVPRAGDRSTARLGALLWLLGIGAAGATCAIALIELTDFADQNVALLTGLVAVLLTLVLTPLRPEPHLVVALAGGIVLTVIGVVGQYDRATSSQYGIALVAVGLGLMLFAWSGALASEGAGYLLGGGIAFVGTEMLGDVAEHWPVVVGLSIGAVALGAFVAVRHKVLLLVGLTYSAVFLVQGIVLASNDQGPEGHGNTWVVLVAFLIGVVLLAGAVYAVRRRE